MRVIVALSGGKASAYCAWWALENYRRKDVILYFNDVKWEHPDLYRFLDDLSDYLRHPITEDPDGRSPEDLFYYHHALANNRMPFCSRQLKAERLQKFYRDEDILVFGIGKDEINRACRLIGRYQVHAVKTNKFPKIKLPLIQEEVDSNQVDSFIQSANLTAPELYRLGFSHNNCSGGCVRAGKKQWKRLYDFLPHVYLERERVEREVGKFIGKEVSFFKDETLSHFRRRIEIGDLSAHYNDEDDEPMDECIGICSAES